MRLHHAAAPLSLVALLAACGDSLVDHRNTAVRDTQQPTTCGPNLVQCGTACTTQVVGEPGWVCGTSCQPCAPTGIGNSTLTCTPVGAGGHDGVCGFECDPGLLKTAAGCSAPKLVAAGANFSCATASDTGEVHCWGDNSQGQLGPGVAGTSRSTSGKVDFALLTGVTALAAGPAHACAAVGTGEVYCWGDATGWGGNVSTATPVPVAELTGATKLTAGLRHTCGITNGSTLVCAGAPTDGGIPTTALAGTQVLEIAAGDAFTCALVNTSPHNVQCWGDDFYGQLGDGVSGAATSTPKTVTGIPITIQHIAAGAHHACASNDTTTPVYCWGDGTQNQLGLTTGAHLPPTQNGRINKAVTRMTAGLLGTCAVMLDPGEILNCWSADAAVAGGTAIAGERNAVSFAAPPGAISMGADHTCFVEAAVSPNRLHCFGRNASGQLGDGTTTAPTAGTVVTVVDR